AAALRRVSVGDVHERSSQNGRIRQPGVGEGTGVGGCGYHRSAERVPAVPDILMYRRILVAVENSAADRTILDHVAGLARLTGAQLVLVHVADGWVARNFDQLKLRESEEMKSDRAYLESLQRELAAQGLSVETHLALGDPATELIKSVEDQQVDLIAMSTHGHRYLSDLLHGATADRVRHLVKIPVLLLRAQ